MEREERILKEIHYRRDKEWNIFTWTTNLILAAIGGFITISSSNNFILEGFHNVILALSVACLGIFSMMWIKQNMNREANAVLKLDEVVERNLKGIYDLPPTKKTNDKRKTNMFKGYNGMIGLLSILAISLFVAPLFFKSETSIVYEKKSQNLILTLPEKAIKYPADKLDSAIQAFRKQILNK